MRIDILGNLLSNAVRYTDKGGVIIGCRRIQGKVWIEVRDTGIGIPQDKTTEIFEEFKQLANSERNREKGSGLGLAIVKRTADLLGLKVRVSSKPGRGSSFSIKLPLGNAARIAPAPPTIREGTERKLRIALVEDDASLRQTLAYVLEDIGHRVVAAPSSQVVLAGLGETPPDILIADYRLGGMETGIDTIAAITNAFGVLIPAIILTGETAPDVLRKIAEKGVQVHHKPVKLETLTASIRELTMPVALVWGNRGTPITFQAHESRISRHSRKSAKSST
jgi:CheY-like chemotaxis protein